VCFRARQPQNPSGAQNFADEQRKLGHFGSQSPSLEQVIPQ
jgi:hypothetical protein